jgi:hypothetical protein
MATADLGQGFEQTTKARARDWTKLIHIPGVTGHLPPSVLDTVDNQKFLLTMLGLLAIFGLLLLWLKWNDLFGKVH